MRRIAWFTPFTNKSAIAACSKVITDELKKFCEVHIWTADSENLLDTQCGLHIFKASELSINQLNLYDAIFYNLGNYHPFHAQIYEVLKLKPGVVILHDVIMHHFLMVEYLEHLKDPDSYVNEMYLAYGDEGRLTALEALDPCKKPIWLSDSVSRFPLFEPILGYATSLFVHSEFHKNILSKHFLGRIYTSYLPYEMSDIVHIDKKFLSDFGIPTETFLVVSTGIVHPIKQIHKILENIRDNCQLINNISYVLIGGCSIEYHEELLGIISDTVLDGRTWILGYQPNDVLNKFLCCADAAINIRYPNSEGCSLSLIEQMAHGLPVIVYDSGVYHEMPDNSVVKISDVKMLGAELDNLVANYHERKFIASNAQTFSCQKFTTKAYVGAILRTITDELKYSPIIKTDLFNGVTSALAEMMYNPDVRYKPIANMLEDYSKICCEEPEDTCQAEPKRFTALGIWLAFNVSVDIRREGITRFLLYLIKAMIDLFQIKVEIWCYSINVESMRVAFSTLLNDSNYKHNVSISHEKKYIENNSHYLLPQHFDCNEVLDNLYEIANQVSDADAFLIGIPYLDNAAAINKPLFVSMHDLIVLEKYFDFTDTNPSFIRNAQDVRESAEKFSRVGASFFCNSNYVLNEHLKKYIRGINDDKATVVYLPVNIPVGHDKITIAEEELRSIYKLVHPYFIYPTQARPHKNIQTLLKAANLLASSGEKFHVVLTATPDIENKLLDFVDLHGLSEYIIFTNDLDEQTLYALYRYANATPVTTTFEAGFPWQAMESMLMGTPVILSKIEAVLERLEKFSISDEKLPIFQPYDYSRLAEFMKIALYNREEMALEQKEIAAALLKYCWNDVANEYYRTIQEEILK